MNATTLLFLLLSHGGDWISETENSVFARWTLADAAAALPAELIWELKFDDVRLAGGSLDLQNTNPAAELKLICPEVRVRLNLKFVWRLVRKGTGKELASGVAIIHAYPPDLTESWPALVRGLRIVVVDPGGDLSAFLAAAKVPHQTVTDTSRLTLFNPAIVLVAPDALTSSRFEQEPLLRSARAGASVLVFRQTRITELAGCELVSRRLPRQLHWQADHSLLMAFTADTIETWQSSLPMELLAVRLPLKSGARAVISWPREEQPRTVLPAVMSLASEPSDALLAVRSQGQGRVVVCQIPLGDWGKDPHAQLLLSGVLDYFRSSAKPVAALPTTGSIHRSSPKLTATR